MKRISIKHLLIIIGSIVFITSCSSDFYFDDSYSQQNSYDFYVTVDLTKPYNKDNNKDNYMFMEAMRRIDQNIKYDHGLASLSHVTAKELQINEDFFEFMNSLLNQIDSNMVNEYLIKNKRPRTKSSDYEMQAYAFEMMGYALAAAKIWSIVENCPLIYDLFVHWINGGGDYELSESEWSDLKSCINSNKPSDFENLLGPDSQMGGYYYAIDVDLDGTKYHYALGPTHAFWSQNEQCIGVYELYDMNPGNRPFIAEYAVRFARTYGDMMGTARDYYVKAGLYKTNE